MSKEIVKLFVAHPRGVAIDSDGTKYRNEWIDIELLNPGEIVRNIAYTQEGTNLFNGLHANAVSASEINNLVGRMLTIVDAIFSDKEQRDALKKLVTTELWSWHSAYSNTDSPDMLLN